MPGHVYSVDVETTNAGNAINNIISHHFVSFPTETISDIASCRIPYPVPPNLGKIFEGGSQTVTENSRLLFSLQVVYLNFKDHSLRKRQN